MSRFQYQGRNEQGQLVEGFLEVSNSDAAVSQLLGRGITPVKVFAAVAKDNESGATQFSLNKWLGAEKIKPQDLIMLTRQLYTISRSGIPLIKGIRGLANSIRHPRLNQVLVEVSESLQTGVQLSAAMAKHEDVFDRLYLNMVRVGEDSGRLEEVFNQLSLYLERDLETRKRIKTALRYPTFVLIALTIAMVVINIMVVPAFADMFTRFDAKLPIATRALIGTSNFFVAYWPHLLIGLVAVVIGFRYYTQKPEGAIWWGKTKLHLPVTGSIVYRALMARYARAFSLMLQTDVPLPQALELSSRAMDNAWLGEKIIGIKEGIERGESLTRTHSQSGLFLPLIMQMISVGEESGEVDRLLEEVAGFYEREVDYDVKTLSDRIEPIIIVAMAGFVLVLALGIFLPMWEMYSIQK